MTEQLINCEVFLNNVQFVNFPLVLERKSCESSFLIHHSGYHDLFVCP